MGLSLFFDNALHADSNVDSVSLPETPGNKAHQKYRYAKQSVDNLMAGYDNLYLASQNFRLCLDLLRSPDLPFYEMEEVLSTVSGRIPSLLLASLKSECTAGIEERLQFSASQFTDLLRTTRIGLPKDALDSYDSTVVPMYEIMKRYNDGMKMHERRVIVSLLNSFLDVEGDFNTLRYEDVILRLRDLHKNDPQQVLLRALSNSKRTQKEDLMLEILDQVRSDNDGSYEWKSVYLPVLEKLANLSGPARTALRARELLIYYHLPTFESRYERILILLQKSVTPTKVSLDPFFVDTACLRELITANYAILDVLPSFCHHSSPRIRVAAMYTYILHTYQSYSVQSIAADASSCGHEVVTWELLVREQGRAQSTGSPSSPVPHGLPPTSTSLNQEMCSLLPSTGLRRGMVSTFIDLEASVKMLPGILGEILGDDLDGSSRNLLTIILPLKNMADPDSDDVLVAELMRAVLRLTPVLKASSIRRLTFVLTRENSFPLFFTYRGDTLYYEDTLIRHIDPAMAYQLELQRLSNFGIKSYFASQRLHVYQATAKNNPVDVRFFVRSLVYPGELGQEISAKEFLRSEGHRTMTDIMDALQMVGHTQQNYDCNHIFMSFVPTFMLDVQEVEGAIREFLDRHGMRLFKLRVTSAEIRFLVKSSGMADTQAFRFMISNVSGFVTTIEKYLEWRSDNGYVLRSIGEKLGPFHRQLLYAPYPPKESIQPRRYRAHLLGTTYVYDFPDLFKAALEKTWDSFLSAQSATSKKPNTLLTCDELLIGEDGILSKTNRSPGTYLSSISISSI